MKRFRPLGLTVATAVGALLCVSASFKSVGAEAADKVAPWIVSLAPPLLYGPVPRNAAIQVTFSEPMAPATVDANAFQVSFQYGEPPPSTTVISGNVEGSVTYDEPSRTATFRPKEDLQNGWQYRVTVAKGMTDLAGNPLKSAFAQDFYVGTESDLIPPTATLIWPWDAGQQVPTNTAIQVTFSESMDARSINSETFVVTQGGEGVSGTVDYGEQDRWAIFRPLYPLEPDTTYTVIVTTGIRDLANNAASHDISWQFGTGAAGDTTPPSVVSVSPPDGGSLSWQLPKVEATFSEPMDPETINAATVQTNATISTISYDPATRKVSFLIDSTWYDQHPAKATIRCTLTAGIRDLAGNSLPAEYKWTFSRGAVPHFDVGGGLGLGGVGGGGVGCFVSALSNPVPRVETGKSLSWPLLLLASCSSWLVLLAVRRGSASVAQPHSFSSLGNRGVALSFTRQEGGD